MTPERRFVEIEGYRIEMVDEVEAERRARALRAQVFADFGASIRAWLVARRAARAAAAPMTGVQAQVRA